MASVKAFEGFSRNRTDLRCFLFLLPEIYIWLGGVSESCLVLNPNESRFGDAFGPPTPPFDKPLCQNPTQIFAPPPDPFPFFRDPHHPGTPRPSTGSTETLQKRIRLGRNPDVLMQKLLHFLNTGRKTFVKQNSFYKYVFIIIINITSKKRCASFPKTGISRKRLLYILTYFRKKHIRT